MSTFLGSRLFRAFFTLVNEYGEILDHALTNSTGHEEMIAIFRALKGVYNEMNRPYPSYLCTDNCCQDRGAARAVFGDLVVEPAEVSFTTVSDLPQLKLGTNCSVLVLSDPIGVATQLEALYRACNVVSPSEDPNVVNFAPGVVPAVEAWVGFDTEYKVADLSDGYP